MAEKLYDGKGASAPRRVSVIFQRFQFKKYDFGWKKKKEKYSKFKNDSKRPQLAFNKELRVIEVYTFEIRMTQKHSKN